ncbi:MAG: hydroxyisourate hydrolase [Solirubrobacteraceae bacterium]|nr:hydroxyisourate hydrolase [Solirubrobacteraceae bacterium]
MAQGSVTLHVLDGYHGRPGAGIDVELDRLLDDGTWGHVKALTTDAKGRTEEPLLPAGEYETGRYQIRLDVGGYFGRLGAPTTQPPYLTELVLRLNFADPDGQYHVPITVSPWGYTHFRGSH